MFIHNLIFKDMHTQQPTNERSFEQSLNELKFELARKLLESVIFSKSNTENDLNLLDAILKHSINSKNRVSC